MLQGAELLGERGLVQGLGCAQFPSRVNPLVGSILKTNLTQWPRAARLRSVPCPAQIPGVPGPLTFTFFRTSNPSIFPMR